MPMKKKEKLLIYQCVLFFALLPLAIYLGYCRFFPAPAKKLYFSQDMACQHVRKIESFGSRTPGSPGYHEAYKYIRGYLLGQGLKTIEISYDVTREGVKKPVKNVIGVVTGSKGDIIMIATRYDMSQKGDWDRKNGLGILLELARSFSEGHIGSTIWIAFFDGSGEQGSAAIGPLIPSLRKSGELKSIRACIITDLEGGEKYYVGRQGSDAPGSAWMTERIREAARGRYEECITIEDKDVIEDCIPFIEEGIPTLRFSDHPAGAVINPGKPCAEALSVPGNIIMRSLRLMAMEINK